LLLLDLALADASGLDVLREIRTADGVETRFDPRLPVIVLSGHGAETDRIRGLDSGADDYVAKPFRYEELRARIGAVLRRRDGPSRVGDLTVDPVCRKVTVGDREVSLAKKELTLLRVLASDPPRVFSKEEMLREVWGFRDPNKTRTLEFTRQPPEAQARPRPWALRDQQLGRGVPVDRRVRGWAEYLRLLGLQMQRLGRLFTGDHAPGEVGLPPALLLAGNSQSRPVGGSTILRRLETPFNTQ
jgi:CheY-like chemotaxis protein